MKVRYQTRDGQLFKNRSQAVDHEKELFKQWLADSKEAEIYRQLLAELPDDRTDEYYGTPRHICCDFVRLLWDAKDQDDD
ncbi:MAG: hypothetical protein ACYSWO_08635 [Planctomycetota bacterium]|jgi:hypothetical protein